MRKHIDEAAELAAYERLLRTGIPLDYPPSSSPSKLKLQLDGLGTVYFISTVRNYLFPMRLVNPTSRPMRVDSFELALAPWEEPNFHLLDGPGETGVDYYNLPLFGRHRRIDRSQVLNEYLEGAKALVPRAAVTGVFLAQARGELAEALRAGQWYRCNVSLTDHLGLSVSCPLEIRAKPVRLRRSERQLGEGLWAPLEEPATERTRASSPEDATPTVREDADGDIHRDAINYR